MIATLHLKNLIVIVEKIMHEFISSSMHALFVSKYPNCLSNLSIIQLNYSTSILAIRASTLLTTSCITFVNRYIRTTILTREDTESMRNPIFKQYKVNYQQDKKMKNQYEKKKKYDVMVSAQLHDHVLKNIKDQKK